MGCLLAGGIARLWLAATDQGIYWPDEIYQSLEPAHRLVFGYGLVAWEFIQGARNWALPGLVAALLYPARAHELGPAQYLPLVKGAFGLLSLAAAYGAYLLARAYGADRLSASCAAALLALGGPLIYFAPRAMSENASATAAVLGLALVLTRNPARWQLLLGGSLLGAAVLLRLHTAIFCVVALAQLSWRSWRDARWLWGVLAVWAFFFGLLDHLTWGSLPSAKFGGWFHSALEYLRFNLLQDGAAGWGVSPWHFYFRHLFTAMPAIAVVSLLLALWGSTRALGLFVSVALFLGLHSWTGHKEWRFLLPMLPLLFALAAVGLSKLKGKSQLAATALVLLSATASFARHKHLTFGDLGAYPERASATAYDDYGAVNRLLLKAHEQADLCGLRIDLAHLAWTGGHSYLHRNVPIYMGGRPALSSGVFNYVITWQSPALSGEIVARDSKHPNMVLARVLTGCRVDPGYSWRLP